jgi:hypothetical protein
MSSICKKVSALSAVLRLRKKVITAHISNPSDPRIFDREVSMHFESRIIFARQNKIYLPLKAQKFLMSRYTEVPERMEVPQ